MRLDATTFAIALLASATALSIGGCSGVEKAKPTPQPASVDRSLKLDIPEILSGTIASETVVLGYEQPGTRGYQPVIARGYGLVVGLNGTGSRDIPPEVRAYMLAEAAKGGFGSERYGEQVASISPEELLNSPDTAAVVVEAVVPQGAVKGTRFDVRVLADPRTGTTSLEGGRLYTTALRPGPATAGGAQAFALAHASGPVFVNPFAEPGALSKDAINRNVGRVLNGGVVLEDMPLKLRLANPSHRRAAMLQSAINTRFPQEPGQAAPTARGESDESLEITVPPSFGDRTDEFIELLRHTTIQQANPEGVAMSIRRAMLANPLVARAASWRWQALGPRILPLIKDLYDYPEEVPRLAALRAGASLDDALVVTHLVAMASGGSADARLQAIQLLARMGLNPQIDLSLRKLLDADDVEVRLEAYEALVERHDPYLRRYNVDGKFILDVVESERPLIYITQIGEPRIVLFGAGIEIQRPATVRAWSDRFMLTGDTDKPKINVYYRAPDADLGLTLATDPNLESFVQFLGHTTTIEKPMPGLGLTYGESVGALHEVWKQKYIKADFRAQQDRILAAIMRQRASDTIEERPEFAEPATEPASDATSDLGRLPAFSVPQR